MKKFFAMILVAVMVIGMLAGCGPTGQNETYPPKGTDGSKQTEASKDTQGDTQGAEPPADADPLRDWILEEDTSISGTVNFWVPFKGNQGMDDMIAEFNTVYPNITVNLNTYNNNSDGNLSVNAAIIAGGQVDVLASFGLNQTYKRWENNLYMDLTDKLAEEHIDLVTNWGTDVYKYDGKVYTLPNGGQCDYININMTAWNEANLGPLPTEWTWDEYLEACKAMTKVDENGNVLVYGGSDAHSVQYFTYPVYQVYGKDNYYNQDGTASSFDSELVIKALERELKAELEDKIWFPKATYRSDNLNTIQPFTQGKTASANSQIIYRSIRDTENYPVDFITGFAPYPTEEKGQTNYCAGTYVFSHVGIATGCQDVDAAWAFTKWYATYGSKYLAIAGHAAVWKGTENDDLVSLIFGSEEEAAKLIDVESFKRVVGRTDLPTHVDTVLTAYDDVVNTLTEYGMYALNGEMSAREAMEEAAEIANDYIAREAG